MSAIPSFESDLAGINFRPAEVKELILALPIGAVLDLERDRENPWDENAVKVLSNGEFLGFVQKFVAQYLSIWLDKGHLFSCTLKSFNGPKRVPVLSIEPTGEMSEPYEPEPSHTPDFNPHGADDDIIPF